MPSKAKQAAGGLIPNVRQGEEDLIDPPSLPNSRGYDVEQIKPKK